MDGGNYIQERCLYLSFIEISGLMQTYLAQAETNWVGLITLLSLFIPFHFLSNWYIFFVVS